MRAGRAKWIARHQCTKRYIKRQRKPMAYKGVIPVRLNPSAAVEAARWAECPRWSAAFRACVKNGEPKFSKGAQWAMKLRALPTKTNYPPDRNHHKHLRLEPESALVRDGHPSRGVRFASREGRLRGKQILGHPRQTGRCRLHVTRGCSHPSQT